MMNEMNILKAQEMVGEPNSDGTSKKNKNMVRKGNNGSKKGIPWIQVVLVVLLLKREGLVGIRLQNKEYCLIIFCNCNILNIKDSAVGGHPGT